MFSNSFLCEENENNIDGGNDTYNDYDQESLISKNEGDKNESDENQIEPIFGKISNYENLKYKEIQGNNFLIDNSSTIKQTNYISKILTKKRKRPEEERTQKKKGRKKRDSNEGGGHDKFCEDNMMRKIKSNFMSFTNDLINNNFNNDDYYLLKLDAKINETLTKEYNLNLMNQSFKNLYLNEPIMAKYKNKDKEHNKKLIQKIYKKEREEESKVISLLDKTYLNLYKYFINTNLNTFLDDIIKEEKNKNESDERIEDYKKNIKKLCLGYEEWFIKKRGRKRNEKKDD